jgi:predicted ABC-type transport system involved in lysophospholipase L1 biosynthesis ATPase subunit
VAVQAILRTADSGAAVLLDTHDADVVLPSDRQLHVLDGQLTEIETLV